MLDKFWEAAGEKLADRWAGTSVPALIFWLGGLLCWISGHGGTSDLRKVADWAGKQSAPVQLVILLTALLGVAASGVIVQRLATVGLRLIEGYWPSFAGRMFRWRTKTIAAKAKSLEDRYQELAGPVLEGKSATAAQRAEFSDIDQRLRRFPVDGDYLPTKTGNIMRAGERRPAEKYGLNAIVVWPRLWLLLPDGTRGELSQARSALDSAVAALIWGVLFFGFTALAWWATLVAIAVVLAMYLYWIPDRAAVFADLLESAFDVHRGLLYQSLRWPLPRNPGGERACGEQVTSYLLRGLDGDVPTFTSDTRQENARPPTTGRERLCRPSTRFPCPAASSAASSAPPGTVIWQAGRTPHDGRPGRTDGWRGRLRHLHTRPLST